MDELNGERLCPRTWEVVHMGFCMIWLTWLFVIRDLFGLLAQLYKKTSYVSRKS